MESVENLKKREVIGNEREWIDRNFAKGYSVFGIEENELFREQDTDDLPLILLFTFRFDWGIFIDGDSRVTSFEDLAESFVIEFGGNGKREEGGNGGHRISNGLALEVERCSDDGDGVRFEVSVLSGRLSVKSYELFQFRSTIDDTVMGTEDLKARAQEISKSEK